MTKPNVLELPVPEVDAQTAKARSVLEEIVRQGALQLLQQAIENEVAEYLERHQQERDEKGRQQVVRNGHLPQREGKFTFWLFKSSDCGAHTSVMGTVI
jgi:hypothetical protein